MARVEKPCPLTSCVMVVLLSRASAHEDSTIAPLSPLTFSTASGEGRHARFARAFPVSRGDGGLRRERSSQGQLGREIGCPRRPAAPRGGGPSGNHPLPPLRGALRRVFAGRSAPR